MSSEIDTAVILAAGIGGKSLVGRSVEILRSFGIQKIILGVGYLYKSYQEYFSEDHDVTFVMNEQFEITSSMYTLYQARNILQNPFILLESDLLYDQYAIELLLSHSDSDVILASGPTSAGDEVYIETDMQGNLKAMSKNRADLSSVNGELVGITKLSIDTANSMFHIAEDSFSKSNFDLDYEEAIVIASTKKNIKVFTVDDLVWCEIDNESHWKRAQENILPKLKNI